MSKTTSLTSQDVRGKVLSLRDELIRNLEFIQSCIKRDREFMESYFERFKDLRYRPILARDGDGNPSEYGSPTEIVIEPLAVQFRTTVKSLLDSIRVIESEILPDDDPEGASTVGGGASAKRASLRASFGSAPVEHPEPAPISTPAPLPPSHTGSKVLPESSDRADSGSVPTPPATQSNTPRPWRDTTPRSIVPDKPKPVSVDANHSDRPIDKSETPDKVEPVEAKREAAKPIGLSPALRAQLGGTLRLSRMGAMREKYKKDDDK